ncbi:MAG: hypothetical protein R3B13_22045 [Polyangiaceae bacterium]
MNEVRKGWTGTLIARRGLQWVALAGAVGLAACGSDDDGGSKGGTGGSAGASGGSGGSIGGSGGTGGASGSGGATGGAGGATGGAGGATGGAGGATGGSAGVDGGSDASAGTGGNVDAGSGGSGGTGGIVDAGSGGSGGTGGIVDAGSGGSGGTGGIVDAGPDGGLAANNLVLFHAGQQQSNLGGRAGADTKCATALASEAVLAGATSHAFISVSAADEIRDMPTTYSLPTNRPIVDVNGKKIADDWADLLDGTIDVALDETAVLGAVGNNDSFWHSGSNADGSLHADNCSGWTVTSGAMQKAGRYKVTNSEWISWAATPACSGQYRLLCIAWK